MLRAVAREWLSWVYPFVCELCGRGGLDGCHVCPDCRGSFVPVEPPFCAVCGEPAEGSFIPSGLCRRCAAFLPSFEEARAVYVNTGSLRDLLLAFKYGGAVHLAGSFAQMMAEAVRGILTGSAGKTPARSRAHAPRQTGSKGVQPGAGTGGFTGRGTGLAVCRRAETPAGYASPGQLVAGAAAQTCP